VKNLLKPVLISKQRSKKGEMNCHHLYGAVAVGFLSQKKGNPDRRLGQNRSVAISVGIDSMRNDKFVSRF